MRLKKFCALAGLMLPFFILRAGAQQVVPLVPTGSVWAYSDIGANLGTSWSQPGFDDSLWPAGPAQLGYGDGDEATPVNGGPLNARFITTYFRHKFTLADASLYSGLSLRLLRDDGAIVYLNGVEVFRSNMPGGAVNYLTAALTAVANADESVFLSASINPALLLTGENIVAVEIHQVSPTSSDISFDLELQATLATDAVVIVTQPQSQTLFEGTTARLSVVAQGTPPLHYQWFHFENLLPQATNATLVLPNLTTNLSGNYFVVVSNAFRSATSQVAILTVQETIGGPFVFLTPPNPVEFGDSPAPDGGVGEGDRGAFITAIGNFEISSLGVEADLSVPSLTLVARIYAASGLNRGALLASYSQLFSDVGVAFYDVPISFTFTNGADYDIAIGFLPDSFLGIRFLNFDPAMFADSPYEAGGIIRVRDGEQSGASANYVLPHLRVGVVPQGPPQIRTQPQSRVAFVGADVDFQVDASGLRPLSYQWARDGTALPGGTNSTLLLPSVQLSQAGGYAVVVSNSLGMVTSAVAVLTVQDAAPLITQQPQNRSVTIGEDASFTVAAIGSLPLGYQWRRDGTELPAASSATLTLSAVSTNDAGDYDVVVSNARGSITSAVARLTVAIGFTSRINFDDLTAPCNFDSTLRLTNRYAALGIVFEGPNALDGGAILNQCGSFGVAGFSGSNFLAFNSTGGLMNGGVPRSPETLRFTVPVSRLRLLVGSSQTGVATLTAYNASGTVVAATNLTLTPLLRPLFIEASNITRAVISSTAGYWVVDDVEFSSGPSAPLIVVHPADQTVVEGQAATFQVEASGTAPLRYQWARNNTDIPNATNSILTLTGVTTNQAGAYSVTVTNALGSVTSSNAVLIVLRSTGCDFQSTNRPSVTFNDALQTTTMTIAFDGSNYWSCSGGSSGGLRLARYSATGSVLGRFSPGLDFRSVFTDPSGRLLAREYASRIIHRQISPGTFVQSGVVLNGGVLDDQASVVLNSEGTEYLALSGGTVSRWRTNGVFIASVPLIGFGQVPGENDGIQNRGIAAAGSYWLTYNGNGVLSVWDRTGHRLNQVRLAGAGTSSDSAYSFSYANGRVFIVDVAGGLWRGYDLCVNTPPVILAQPESQDVLSGFDVSFNVGAFGRAPLAYQWFFEDAAISNATSATLLLPAVTVAQSGRYHVVVTNTLGAATSQVAVLSVQDLAPQITSQPRSRAAFAGHVARFAVEATGSLPLGYQWEFNGMAIPAATNATLVLSNVNANRDGEYRVVVTNAYGSITSDPATLLVVPAPVVAVFDDPRFVDTQSGPPNAHSDNVQASLKSALGLPAVPFTNVLAASGSNNVLLFPPFVFSDPTFTFDAATRAALRSLVTNGGTIISLGGDYNAHFIASIFGLPLTVTFPPGPAFTRTPFAAGSAFADDPVTLSLNYPMIPLLKSSLPAAASIYEADQATGVALLRYGQGRIVYLGWNWYDARPLGSQDNGWLEALFSAVEESGPLPPTAPIILLNPRGRTVAVGHDATLSVVATGTSPLRYQWDVYGVDIPGATNATLALTAVTTNDSGIYRVTVSNDVGSTASAKVLISVVELVDETFRISSLSTNNAVAVECVQEVGDDRGGIAASPSHVFLTGDNTTGRFQIDGLAFEGDLGRRYDSMIGDVKTGAIYVLADGTAPIESGFGVATHLLELDGETGALTGNQVELSTPISLGSGDGNVGLFAGYGRVVLHTGRRVYSIFVPSGIVEDLGPMDPLDHAYSENWAYWGVAEFFNNTPWLVYTRNPQNNSHQIARTRVPDGLTLPVATFTNLSDMASITVSPEKNRWYFHHDGVSQFRTGDETLGYADARFLYTNIPQAPRILVQPRNRFVREGRTVDLSVVAAGYPLEFRWFFNGEPIGGGTNEVLTLTAVTTNQTGLYSVIVSNALGGAISSNAMVTVLSGDPLSSHVAIFGAPSTESWQQDIVNKLTETGFFNRVDSFINGRDPVPTLKQLSDYGAVLVYSDAGFNDPQGLGDVLADYVDHGGGVVVAAFAVGYGAVGGRFETDRYAPFVAGGNSFGSADSLVPDLPAHPILSGVTSFNGGSSALRNFPLLLAPGGTLVAHWNNNDPLVGTREILGGRVVNLNFFPPSSDVRADFWDVRTDGALLMASALLWAGQNAGQPVPPAIQVQPANQSTLAGMNVAFEIRAAGSLPLSYQWQRNETVLPGATNRTLLLSRVSLAQNGNYRVVVSNAFGIATSQVASLLVRSPRGIVGYFADYGGDSTNPAPSIVRAGFTPLLVTDISALNLATIDLLFLEVAAAVPSPGLQARLPDIQNWVLGGGRLIVHDAAAGAFGPGSDPLLPGLRNVMAMNSPQNDLSIVPPGTSLVTTGPHGVLTGNSLDNGAPSAVGYVSNATLPDAVLRILSTADNTNQVVALSYAVGAGHVYYSTVPTLWHWTGQTDFSERMRNTYVPNVIEHVVAFEPSGPPAILSAPQNLTALAGGSVSFDVGVSGQGPLRYRWFFNDQEIPGATNATLLLTSVTSNQIGNYQVVVMNSLGTVTTPVAALTIIQASVFKIRSLLSTGARVVDHDFVTGDDRGGIAVSATSVFYTGDNGTGRFSAADLNGGTRLPQMYDALVSNLRTEKVYSLANGTSPLSSGGGTVNALVEVNGVTGALTTNRIDLSQAINLPQGSGLFAGYDAIALFDGSRVYRVDVGSGLVTDLGIAPPMPHAGCENWAFWGVTEFFDGALHLVYVRDWQSIVRTRIPDGATQIVGSFNNLSDMCSFTFSLSRNRWYFHHEGSSQFGGTSETLGYANASWDRPPVFGSFPTTNVLASEDRPRPALNFFVTDDGGSSNAVLNVQSSNPLLLPVSSILVSNAGSARSLIFTPLPDQFGTSIVTVTASDSIANVTNRSFTFVVTPVNDAPTFVAGSNQSLLEDAGPQSVPNWATAISAGPTNEASQALTFEVSNDNPALFTAAPALSPDGHLTYTAASNANGTAQVSVRLVDDGGTADDGTNASPVQTFAITIAPVNDPPSFTKGADYLGLEDSGPHLIPNWASSVGPGPIDEAAQQLTFLVSNSNPQLFSVPPAISPAGDLMFTPAPNANGTATVTIALRDDGGTANGGNDTAPPQTFSITIQPVNDRPVANPMSITVAEDGMVTMTLSASDVEGDPLSYTIVTPPAHGALSGTGGNVTYRPQTNYAGPDSFSFKVNDGTADSLEAMVSITVTPVDDPPVAYSQSITNLEDTPVLITLAGADIEDNLLAYFSTMPANGSLSGSDANVVYTPASNYFGADSFRFRVLAAGTYSDFATVNITVVPVNDPPSFSIGPDVSVAEDAGARTLANWATNISPGPPNESDQTVEFMVINSNPSLFSAAPAISPVGTLTFTPAPDAHGAALVTALLHDSGGTANGGQNTTPARTFTITVTPVNDAPVAHARSIEVAEDTTTAITLTGSDVEGDALSFDIVTPPAHGTLTGVGANRSYTPAAEYNGPDSFTFKVNDGQADSALATVSITVAGLNDPPVAIVTVSPLVYLNSSATGVVLSPNGFDALVVFDASLSHDADSAALTYSWFESGASLPFANGIVGSNRFEVGEHTVVLQVSDGNQTGQQSVTFEIVSPAGAMDELLTVLHHSNLARNRKRPLEATLKSASASLERGNYTAARNQLMAFQNKIRAQIRPSDPALADELMRLSRLILSAMGGGP